MIPSMTETVGRELVARLHLVAIVTKEESEGTTQAAFVVDDEDSSHG